MLLCSLYSAHLFHLFIHSFIVLQPFPLCCIFPHEEGLHFGPDRRTGGILYSGGYQESRESSEELGLKFCVGCDEFFIEDSPQWLFKLTRGPGNQGMSLYLDSSS